MSSKTQPAVPPPGPAESDSDSLIGAVYQELRALAERALGPEIPSHTLQPTALVHEAYLRLKPQRQSQWQNRTQFLAVASRMMRRVLADHSRRRRTQRRGGDRTRITLDASIALAPGMKEGVCQTGYPANRVTLIPNG